MNKTELVRKNEYEVDSTTFLVRALLEKANFLYTEQDVQDLLTSHRILKNNELVTLDVRVVPGDMITLLTAQSEEPSVSESIELLYEDEDMFVVSKPAQLPVHPSGRYYFNTLSSLVERKLGLSGLYPYNRLDRETSGIVIFAKYKEFIQELQNISIDKSYYALVFGQLKDSKGVISAPLAQKTVGELRHHIVVDAHGKSCSTEYEVIAGNERYSLVDLKLLSGRKHQLRVHLAHLGHPIVGDKQYGAYPELLITYGSRKLILDEEEVMKKVKASRQLLHCYKVMFRHPKNNKLVAIEDFTGNFFLDYLEKEKISFKYN